MTPLQQKIQDLIESYEHRTGMHISGRELSHMLGKSRNHLSQIMNDGLVPSGEVIALMAEVLGAEDEERRDLMIAAMRTKATGRARDTYWLDMALGMVEDTDERVEELEDYIRTKDLAADFEKWAKRRRSRRRRG